MHKHPGPLVLQLLTAFTRVAADVLSRLEPTTTASVDDIPVDSGCVLTGDMLLADVWPLPVHTAGKASATVHIRNTLRHTPLRQLPSRIRRLCAYVEDGGYLWSFFPSEFRKDFPAELAASLGALEPQVLSLSDGCKVLVNRR
jgi:hypothetical protein